MKKFLFALGTAVATLQAEEPSRHFQQRVIAAVIWAEARSEGYDAMRAVAEVIRNRAYDRIQTVFEVVIAPKQFSCLNGTAPFRLAERMETATGRDKLARTFCEGLADLLLSGSFRDQRTHGATHFFDNSVFPDWAFDVPVLRINGLCFCKPEE